MNENFVALLERTALAQPDDPFLCMEDGTVWSYGAIFDLSAKLAGALLASGATPGDRICAQIDKSAENVALYLAALRAGLVYVPLNTAYTSSELAYFIDDANPAICVIDPAKAAATAALDCTTSPTLLTLDKDGQGSLMEQAQSATPLADTHPATQDDIAVILYTSGTTGRSKGAMLSHGNLASNAKTLHALWAFEPTDVLLHALPIFHIHGLFVALHTAMLNRSPVMFHQSFDSEKTLEALPDATIMMGVPTFYTRLLADPRLTPDICQNIRLFICGSAPLTKDTHDAFSARTGHAILERYGMSEAGMIASNPVDGDRIAGTVGYPLPGVELRITSDDGTAVATGETGGVEVRGPNVFKGYWNMPEKTAAEFREDGWFITGDVGSLSDDGRLTLEGRAKDMIIAGGYNIYPTEVELALNAIEGIKESAVIAAPHPDMGEGVVAVLVAQGDTHLTEEALQDGLHVLARFKQPRRFYWLDELPRNAMGKVQKQVLREQFKTAFSK